MQRKGALANGIGNITLGRVDILSMGAEQLSCNAYVSGSDKAHSERPFMASRSRERRTWPTSSQTRSAVSRKSGSSTPPEPGSSESINWDSRSWYQKVASCRLESSSGGFGQGIVVELNCELGSVLGVSESPPLAILTSHRIIPSRNHVRDWKIRIGADNKSLKLSDKVNSYYSCCGPDGILGGGVHALADCQLQADFTVLLPKQDFITAILKKGLLVPKIPSLDLQHLMHILKHNQFSLLENNWGIIEAHRINLQHTASPCDENSLENTVTAYRENCRLRYRCDLGELESAGAGITYFDCDSSELMLLGIHTTADKMDRQHFGLAVHAIFHPISGGSFCGVTPCLYQLQEASRHQLWNTRWYQNLAVCLQEMEGIGQDQKVMGQKQGETGQGKGCGPIDLPFLLKILKFILSSEPQILQLAASKQPHLVLPSLQLLIAIFSCFQKLVERMRIGAIQIRSEGEGVFSGSNTFYQSLEATGNQVYKLLCEAAGNQLEIVKACFSCWQLMCTFRGPEETRCCLFYDAAKFSKLKSIRDEYRDSAFVQRAFGDICLTYQRRTRAEKQKAVAEAEQRAQEAEQRAQEAEQRALEVERRVFQTNLTVENKKRSEVKQAQDLAEEVVAEAEQRALVAERKVLQTNLTAKREKKSFEHEIAGKNHLIEQLKSEYEKEIQRLRGELDQWRQECERQGKMIKQLQEDANLRPVEKPRTMSLPSPHGSPYPMRKNIGSSYLKPESDLGFWERDIETLLADDLPLRKKIGKHFIKVQAATGAGTWEHLLQYVSRKVGVDMDARKLETLPLGDIILSIVQEWMRKEKVSVKRFCIVSSKLGNLRIEEIMKEIEAKFENR